MKDVNFYLQNRKIVDFIATFFTFYETLFIYYNKNCYALLAKANVNLVRKKRYEKYLNFSQLSQLYYEHANIYFCLNQLL